MARREIIVPKNDKLNVSRNLNLPHSPGIRAGDFIFLSGMLSTDPQTGERSPGTMAHETRQTLANMRHLLESAGSSLAKVVKVIKSGEITKSVKLTGIGATAGAKAAIEAAGGSVA